VEGYSYERMLDRMEAQFRGACGKPVMIQADPSSA